MRKPPAAGMGRKKGSRNKRTVAVKEALEAAFQGLGGVERLIEWANTDDENLATFYEKMWLKILPLTVDLNRPAPAPNTQPINDPNVLAAALAFDAAVAGAHTGGAGSTSLPVAPLGPLSPDDSGSVAPTGDEPASLPPRSLEGGTGV